MEQFETWLKDVSGEFDAFCDCFRELLKAREELFYYEGLVKEAQDEVDLLEQESYVAYYEEQVEGLQGEMDDYLYEYQKYSGLRITMKEAQALLED